MVRSASRVSTPASNILRQEIDLSPSQPPAGVILGSEPLSFWEQLCEVADGQWASDGEKGFKTYLYEGQSGPYIALITQPFDIEWVKQNFGGGAYRAQLNDPSGKIVASQRFTIEGESKRKSPQSAQAAPASAQPVADSFQSQVLEILRESTRRQEQMMERIMDARGANTVPAAPTPPIDPNIMLRGVVEMFSGLLTKAQAPQPQMGLLEMVALIEKFKGPGLIEQMKEMKEAGLIPANNGAQGDLKSQIESVLEIADKIGGGKGKTLGEAVIEKLPDLLEAGGKAMDKYHAIETTRLATAREVRALQQGRGAALPPAPQPQAATVPQHAGVPPQHHPASPGMTLEVERPQPNLSAEAQLTAAQQQEAFVMSRVVEMIAGNSTGAEIVDFLDAVNRSICDSFQGATAEQIAAYCAEHPILRKAIHLPRFTAAIAELVEELNSSDEEAGKPPKVN